MERHFILPLTIAAAVHAGLLFGIRGNPAVPSPAKEKATIRDDLLRTFLLVPVVDPEPDKSPAIGSPVDSAPTRPEPPPPEHPTGFTIEVPARPEVFRPDVTVIPPGVIGIPDGDPRSTHLGGKDLFSTIDLDSPPRTRLQVPPIYPAEAKHGGRGGNVLVEFTVDEQGAVVAPHVVRSDDRIFEEPTLRAVSRWRFEPGKRGGHIVRFRMAVPIVFNLDEN